MRNKDFYYSGRRCFSLMFILREIYLFAVYLNLNGVYYVGTGSYGIEFVLYKEILGVFIFGILDYIYSFRRTEGIFKNVLIVGLFILYIIPMSCTYSLMNMSTIFFCESSLFCLLLLWAVEQKNKYVFVIKTKKIIDTNQSNCEMILNNSWVRLFCFVCCLLVIGYKILYNGFSFNLMMDSDVLYGNRAVRSLAISSADGTLLGYFISILTNLASYIIPIYLFISIKEKNILSTIVATFSIICSYTVSSEKSTIMIIIVVFVVAWCSKKKDMVLFEKMFVGGVSVGLLYSIFVRVITKKQSILFMLIFRRLMYLPSWLNTLYYEFFSNNSKVWWSQNTIILQKIIPDIYDSSPITLISNFFFNGVIPTPNTGLFADAYLNLGVLGIIIYPILYRLIFNAAQKIYHEYGWEIETLVAFKLVLSLTNVQLLRTNFVISFIFSTVLLYVLSKLNKHI